MSNLQKEFDPVLIHESIQNKLFSNAYEMIEEIRKIRSSKIPDPSDFPNLGSFFKNPILSKKEADKFFKIFFKILKDKSVTVYSTNKETNVLLAFFTYYWVKLNANPKLRLYSICYLCRDYFNEPPKNREEDTLKYYNVFFNAFFTKERILKLKKEYPGTIYSNIIIRNYDLN